MNADKYAGALKLSIGYHYLYPSPFLSAFICGCKEGGMANQMGKRYTCSKCGAEVIVTKTGGGALTCCGQEMQQKK